MSANEDPNIEVLRSAGHDEAADLLDQVRAEREREEIAKRGPGMTAEEMAKPGITLMPLARSLPRSCAGRKAKRCSRVCGRQAFWIVATSRAGRSWTVTGDDR